MGKIIKAKNYNARIKKRPLEEGVWGRLQAFGETNPLLHPFPGIHQTAPFHSITIEHYLSAFESAMEEAKTEVKAVIDNPAAPDFENTIVALDVAGDKLARIKALFFNLNSADTSDEMQDIAQEVAPKISDFANDVTLNEQLFVRIGDVYDRRKNLLLNVEESTLLEKTYRRFVRSGANLNGQDKLSIAKSPKSYHNLG